MSIKAAAGPRERLLDAAKELTYQQGTGVGIDALLKTANVARRSLYEHFGGKDGLIAEVLRVTAAEDEAAYEQAMRSAGDDSRGRVLAIFDWLDTVIAEPGFRGCRYLAADLALADPAHPGHVVTGIYNERIHEILKRELRDHGHADPGLAADQLVVLINGALAVGVTRPQTHPALAARQLAEQVLDTGS